MRARLLIISRSVRSSRVAHCPEINNDESLSCFVANGSVCMSRYYIYTWNTHIRHRIHASKGCTTHLTCSSLPFLRFCFSAVFGVEDEGFCIPDTVNSFLILFYCSSRWIRVTLQSPPDLSSTSRFFCSRFRHSYWHSYVWKRKKIFLRYFFQMFEIGSLLSN